MDNPASKLPRPTIVEEVFGAFWGARGRSWPIPSPARPRAAGRRPPADPGAALDRTRVPVPGYREAELAYAVPENVTQGTTVAVTRSIVAPGDDRQGHLGT